MNSGCHGHKGSFSLLQWITKLKCEKNKFAPFIASLWCIRAVSAGILPLAFQHGYQTLNTWICSGALGRTGSTGQKYHNRQSRTCVLFLIQCLNCCVTPNSTLFFLFWGFPLCQDWFHSTLGVTLLVKGKEISIFREWLMWPILDVTFSLRRITPLIKTCFTLSYITATIGHMDHLNLEEKSLTGELGASLSLFAHKHFNYTTERVAKATGAFICFLWSHTEQHYLILRAQFCFIYESSYFKEEKKSELLKKSSSFLS